MKIISRAEAKAAGLARYFTGKPCKRGHVDERRTAGGNCLTCHKKQIYDWHKNNPEKAAAKHKKHRDKVIERYREGRNAHVRKRYRRDVEFRLSIMLRSHLRRLRDHVDDPSGHSISALPYSSRDLKAHLESLFQPGMSWGNYGDWHIDHIKSVKAFLAEGVTDPAKINALENLQPLWAAENISKGSGLEDGNSGAHEAPI